MLGREFLKTATNHDTGSFVCEDHGVKVPRQDTAFAHSENRP
jgi:hypothetical protein